MPALAGILPRNDAIAAEHRHFFLKVYLWMAAGLLVSAALAYWVYVTPSAARAILENRLAFDALLLGEFIAVIVLAAGKNSLSLPAMQALFIGYCALTGLTLSVVLFRFTTQSVLTTFCVTAGMFALVGAYGGLTDHDLSSWGHVLLSGLLGLILASLSNLWLHSPMIDWLVTYSGIVIFTALIAYDTNKIKALDLSGTVDGGEQQEREAIEGALDLYLDFINLFLKLLSAAGKRK